MGSGVSRDVFNCVSGAGEEQRGRGRGRGRAGGRAGAHSADSRAADRRAHAPAAIAPPRLDSLRTSASGCAAHPARSAPHDPTLSAAMATTKNEYHFGECPFFPFLFRTHSSHKYCSDRRAQSPPSLCIPPSLVRYKVLRFYDFTSVRDCVT